MASTEESLGSRRESTLSNWMWFSVVGGVSFIAAVSDIRGLTPRSLPMIAMTTGLLAVILLAITLQDAFEVMLLPRAVQRQVRLVSYYYRVTWAAWRAIARGFPAGHRREHFLGIYGALSMVILFAAWASSLIIGFGMLFWALQAETQTTLADQLYKS